MTSGSIVLVQFPFTSLEKSKKRPALILSIVSLTPKAELITIAMVTSQVDGMQITGDVILEDWEKEGLLHASLVRLSKIATIEKKLLNKELGRISVKDTKLVKASFQKLYKFWI